MGKFSIKKTFSSAAKSFSGTVKSAVSQVSSVGTSFGKNVYSIANSIPGVNTDKIKEVAEVGTGQLLANAPAIVAGFASGGVMGAVGAATSVVGNTMAITDRSGKFNANYWWKQAGFPSQMSADEAGKYGYVDYGEWCKFAKANNLDPDTGLSLGNPWANPTTVIPTENAKNIDISPSGNVTVSPAQLTDETASSGGNSGVGKLALVAVGAKLMGVL